ncbi:MAG: DUF1475 family protein [Thermoanaerobaculia bacterium]|nr:DUF1475 family protein [Thermoanaerobaculia bacterium]
MTTTLRLFFVGVLLVMVWVTYVASLDRNVLLAAREIWSDPWGRATLVDAYLAFLVVWIWIAWRERNRVRAAAWLVALLLLGNFAIATYFLLALYRQNDRSWTSLFEQRR